MKNFLKRNYALVLAFSLPLLLIIIVALNAYLPSLYLSTDYNFIYSTCTDNSGSYSYRCNKYLQKRYVVLNDRLVLNNVDPKLDSDNDGIPDINENYTTRIFLHDTEKNESREITLEEAQVVKLSGLISSPDGVTISNNYERGAEFFPFFDSGSSYGYYLTKGKSKKKLNLINPGDGYYYGDDFQFIGWTLPSRNY